MSEAFDELLLKPGAQWFSGEWAQRLLKAIKSDRIIPGSGIQQFPSPTGRMIYVQGGGRPVRVCIGGIAKNVRLGDIKDHPDDETGEVDEISQDAEIFAHLPFLPEPGGDLTPGSFISAVTEDQLMDYVWRLRRWNFYGFLDLFHDNLLEPDETYTQIENPEGPGYISNGEDNSIPFSEFTGPDEILTSWRRTRQLAISSIIDEGSGMATPDIDIWWGPRGTYHPNSGGRLDSFFELIAHPNGDEQFRLSTQEFDDSKVSNVSFIFDPSGINSAITLYETDEERWSFQGALVIEPGSLYHPWTINGEDTWSTTTGEQLLDPLRLDSNGSPLAYLAQQE